MRNLTVSVIDFHAQEWRGMKVVIPAPHLLTKKHRLVKDDAVIVTLQIINLWYLWIEITFLARINLFFLGGNKKYPIGMPLLDNMDIGINAKMAVRRIMGLLAKGTEEPFGITLLLNTKRVIDTIEAYKPRGIRVMPVRGRTTLGYFISVLRVLKEMEYLKVPGAAKAKKRLQKYKDKNYQQFAQMGDPPIRQTSQVRKEIVDEHKDAFEINLGKVIHENWIAKMPLALGMNNSLTLSFFSAQSIHGPMRKAN